MAVVAFCRQCGRDVEHARYDHRNHCCRDCRAARLSLYRYWQSKGMAVFQHKPNRRWLPMAAVEE
jgi:hypothetical protein